MNESITIEPTTDKPFHEGGTTWNVALNIQHVDALIHINPSVVRHPFLARFGAWCLNHAGIELPEHPGLNYRFRRFIAIALKGWCIKRNSIA